VAGHPGAEAAVGDVDVVVRSGVDGDGEVGRRQLDDLDPARPAGSRTGRNTSTVPAPWVNSSLA
jgi:hypothetical protein